jgi:hypothetical protein
MAKARGCMRRNVSIRTSIVIQDEKFGKLSDKSFVH